ncbi:hypothetical protein KFL_000140500 [Klebsormidium nitens]|uniref:Uncharacterized protein n=1 Tax=Klebsormidium nitens TaxID=105231 RepID=A0A1Y1HMW7_KLENI|nr:hypothetical protein KFL_000140500 [Klebsormidium nitens]|eukprot:GAQ78529.1 hypothetical protein KFL_000140500 [Klebsormidium nitens]
MDRHKANHEQQHEDLCVRLKSWCDQWVSIAELGDGFSSDTGDSGLDTAGRSQINAHRGGSKECQSSLNLTQALIACELEEESSCLLAVKPRQDGKYDLQICDGLGQGLGHGLFLGFVGRRVGLKQRSGLDTAFAIQFADRNRVCFQGGSENLFLSADPQGRIYTGPTRPRKWEWFTMLPTSQPGPSPSRPMPLPVRVNLRGHNGRYLCTSHATVSAHAEVPCCCEEFLLQVGPIPQRDSADSEIDASSSNDWNTISAASEDEILSADPSGGLSIVPRENARGREHFLVHLTCPKWPRVAILHQTLPRDPSLELSKQDREEGPSDRGSCTDENGNGRFLVEVVKSEQGKAPGEFVRSYVGVESNGRVVCDRPQPQTWEQFTLELVSGSRVFIQGVNGRFLAGAPKFDGSERTPVNVTTSRPPDCWEVRSHGDGLCTLVLAPVETGRGETYLFVDDFGRLQQSNEPAVQFPATCSLFSLEPVAAKALRSAGQERGARNPAKELLAHLSRRGEEDGLGSRVSDERIVGFSIRTAGKVSGRERYLSVEPNGAVKASRTRVGRTEVFALSDVNALAARADPIAFPCHAAATANPLQTPPAPPPATAQERAEVRAAEEATAREARVETSRQRQKVRAAARALETRAPNPKPRPATLQALCADAIATEAARRLPCAPRCTSPAACLSSWGVGLPHLSPPKTAPKQPLELGSEKCEALLDEMLGVLAGAAAPPCCYDGAFPEETRTQTMRVIPNDVLDQIDATWAARQPRAHSCKGHVAPYRRFPERARARAFQAMHRAPHRGFGDEGFVCKQCSRDGLTRLDPVINPAHHRFLEVQQRLRGVNGPLPRAMWNPLTLTAVSMVSTLLCFSRGPSGGGRPRTGDSE